jgi:hypothetical protein
MSLFSPAAAALAAAVNQPKRRLLTLLALLCPFLAFAQGFAKGAVLDPALYESLPRKAEQVTRAYESLPPAASLKQYAPSPGNQNPYRTCAAWSSVYTARTILESIALNRFERWNTTANVFSPNYVYKRMFLFNNKPDDPAGERGAAIAWALRFMRDEGPVKM